MVDARRVFGDNAEALAARHLEASGMRMVARQFRTRYGEIDLIALDGDEVVFVEVKARTTNAFGYPEESVTKAKLRKVARCADMFLRAKRWEDRAYRIDVIAIEFVTEPPRITHLVGVGYA